MPTTYYTNANGMILGEQTGNGPHIDYIPDALGSVVAAVDQNLNTTFTAAYSPFGDVIASTGTAPNFTWVGTLGYLQSAGRPFAEYSVRNRIYSSTTGRWTSVDPYWPTEPSYGYGKVNPTTKVDPSGLASCSINKFAVTPKSKPVCKGYVDANGILQLMVYKPVTMLCNAECSGNSKLANCGMTQQKWRIIQVNIDGKGQNTLLNDGSWKPDPGVECPGTILAGDPEQFTVNGIDAPGYWSHNQPVGCNMPTVSGYSPVRVDAPGKSIALTFFQNYKTTCSCTAGSPNSSASKIVPWQFRWSVSWKAVPNGSVTFGLECA